MKRNVILSLLGIFIIAEVIMLGMVVTKDYENIEDKIKEVTIDQKNGTILDFRNISVGDRNYTKLVCKIQNEEACIISLKTNDDELVIPRKIGKYSVKSIGGKWYEISEMRGYAQKNQKTKDMGMAAWMEDDKKTYKAIIIEEGIEKINNEAFYGIKTERLELPKSLWLIGATSFANAEIDELVHYNNRTYCLWGAFLNTKYDKEFREISEQNIEDKLGTSYVEKHTYLYKNQTKNEYDMGYKVENDEVIVYGREYKESETYDFDTDIRKLEDHDIDVIKNGIIPPIIEVDDHVKKMTIKKDCRLVWRVDYSTYNPAFDNNLRGCKNLEEINVESGNDSISSLEGILYKNVKKKKCLYACPLKKSGVIIIPEDIDNIWACAFFGCEQITSVEISSSVRGIGNHAFGNMKNCKSIHVNKNNPYYTSENGVLYTKNKKVLVAFPAGKSMDTFVIPEGVEYISEGAFSCVDCIKKIIMPKSLKEICNCAFFSCKNLVSVKARGNVKKIGYYAFYKTPTPKHMNIPRKKGKNSEYSVEWRKLFDGDSLKNDTAWVDGYGFE